MELVLHLFVKISGQGHAEDGTSKALNYQSVALNN